MLLIYGAAAEDKWTEADGPAWDRFNEELRESGAWLGADALRRSSVARTLSVRGGAPIVTDGPFAETKEQLAGYYLVECAGWEAALAIAARIPSAADGSATIEVRPVWDFTATD
jgi:hypothetical protein